MKKSILTCLATLFLSSNAIAELHVDPQAQLYYTDARLADGMLKAMLFVNTDNPFSQKVFLIKDNPRTPGIDQYELIANDAECTIIGSDARLRCVYADYNKGLITTVFATTDGDDQQFLVAYIGGKDMPRETLLRLENARYTEDHELISRLLAE